MKGEKIFITGGAGYLGKELVKRFYENNEITVFSRDEAKHYYLKKKFPKIRCIVGDIRNYDLLSESIKGSTVAIFAASMKQIESVDENITEARDIIINGAINSRKAALEHKLKSAVFISTDKSRSPTTLYGAMKFVAGESFIINAEKETTKLSSVIYGNVLNSTGSIIPLIWDSLKNGYELTLYSESMTRFIIDINQAIDVIEYAAGKTGVNVIPNLNSIKIQDLFEIYKEDFGLRYKIGKPRISEKDNEQMIAPLEVDRVVYDSDSDMFLMHYKNIYNDPNVDKKGLSSENVLLDRESLRNLLKKNDYFKQ